MHEAAYLVPRALYGFGHLGPRGPEGGPPAPPARISQTLRVKGDRFEDPVRSPEHSLVLRRVLNASRTSRSIRNAGFLPCETRVRP